MNDITYAFSCDLEKYYSMEVYVLVGFHYLCDKEAGIILMDESLIVNSV